MATEAQRKAKNKYRDQGKRMTVDFYPSEADLIEHIENQPNKQGYIKMLIRVDLEKARQKAKEKEQRKQLCDLVDSLPKGKEHNKENSLKVSQFFESICEKQKIGEGF